MSVEQAKKAVSTVDLALSLVNIFKAGVIVFTMALLEWARKKQKLAENKEAVANADLEVKKQQDVIQKEADAKSPDTIISEFLNKQ